MKKVFIDMDGVLFDFLGGIAERHNRELPYRHQWAKGIWETEQLWGITEEEFWAPAQDIQFWANLPKTKEADQIINLATDLFGEENIAILTAEGPGMSIQGKKIAIEEHYPQFRKRLIFTHAKEFLAGPDRFLIDDRDKNIVQFEKARGMGILVPRAWNFAWQWEDETFSQVKTQLEAKFYGTHNAVR